MTGNGEGMAELRFKEALSMSLSIPDDSSAEENVAIGNKRDRVAYLLREAGSNYRLVWVPRTTFPQHPDNCVVHQYIMLGCSDDCVLCSMRRPKNMIFMEKLLRSMLY